jgi:putative aldouronate transport system permease protein
MLEIIRRRSLPRCRSERASPVAAPRSSLTAVAHYLFENWTLILLALPGVTLVFLLRYLPMFGIVVAFQDYKLAQGFLSPWVGLRNFTLLWGSPILIRIVKNTLVLNSMFITATTLCSVLVALSLNEVRSRIVRGVYQWVMFLPFFMGWSVVALVLYGLTDYETGTLNVLLTQLGLQRIPIRNEAALWPWLLTAVRVWKDTGSGCIIYLAALMGVNPELYEAAAMDGAGRLERMWYVSVPALIPTIITLTLIAIGNIFFADWGMIYALVGNNALLYPTTEVIDTYILRALRSSVNFGMASATGLSQSLLSFVLVYGSNRLAKRYFDYGLF